MSEQNSRVKIAFNSPVILTFTGICLLSLILGRITNFASTRLFFCVYRSSPAHPLTYVRLIGHVFGHSGWNHFINNIMMILVIGPMLEEKYGSKDILFVILSTALVTGIIHIILFPHVRLLGASGVVFTFILLDSITGFKSKTIPLTFIIVAVIYIGGQIYEGLFVTDNISNLTHIVGGAVGAFFGYIGNKQEA